MRDGAARAWSTFRIDHDGNFIDATMNDRRAWVIIDRLVGDKKYLFRIKFIVQHDNGGHHNGGMYIIWDKNSKPGILTGVDRC